MHSSTIFTQAQAKQAVRALTEGELDGWKYEVEVTSDGHAKIKIFDEDNEFVAYF
ncbi:hypothetical protein LCGC14_1811980 [marine sediment metagenome]|uniref:Uncharacterized protein n=1 Tax=marine sediment metagenome TaxID=412755 RepID=A0A0F9J152_9ZZZZ